jgi:hypothetical protein
MWRFKKLTVGDPERDPHEAEFFHLNDAAESVVREVIQNSLDAKCEDKAIIEFTFGVASKKSTSVFLNNLETHLQATSFDHPDYILNDQLPFLAIEDFGTSGLDGQTGENGERPNGKNNFYNFWWYEGKSEKTGKERGRWGLGKTTFHVASKIRSFWGLTIRGDDKRKLLMGKALLKTHKLERDTYTYNGYFTDENYSPYSDIKIIEEFSKNFSLLRDEEPGFSLVIPLPHSEIKPTAILKSVMIHYFYPILKNNLEIMLSDNGTEQELSSTNIINLASEQDWSGTSWERVNVEELLNFIKSTIIENTPIDLIINDLANPQLTNDSFGQRLEEFRESFNSGKLLAFRIPVEIKEIRGDSNKSYFEVFIQKNQKSATADEYYIRSGITISDIKLLAAYPVKSLFIADDDIIAKFLGDAESPAHTDWKERTEEFREKYEHATRKLRFIKRSLQSIVNIIYLPPKEQKRDFLKELFYVNTEKDIDDDDNKKDKSKDDLKDIPDPTPKRYKLIKADGGFKITRSKMDIIPPLGFKVRCAYDTRKGNPFKNYEIYDFDLSTSDFSFNSLGCTIINKKENGIELLIENNEFWFEVSGFDTVRDLVVDIKEVNQ